MISCDYLVIGAGVMGVTIATELRRRHRDATVVLLEKEDAPGRHASGRNSGVLHAGFYYSANTLKARFTRIGNRLMRAYCADRALRLNACGKLVVARNEADLAGLDELLRRGECNGVTLVPLDEAGARAIEPRARTFRRAIFSPATATVDPGEVMRSLVADAGHAGVRLLCGVRYRARRGRTIVTSAGEISAGFVVNTAGLYADRLARDFGFSRDHRILPFKGLYLYSSQPPGTFRTNIYPVPDLRNPFLGVHVTVTVDGRSKLGPTAVPCLWREQYGAWENFRFGELVETLGLELRLLLGAGFDFRGLAREEIRKYVRSHLVAQAATLADGIQASDYTHWGSPGIRAQLVDVRTWTLEQDFRIEGDESSLHVLNAVSPGWTCALPFSAFVCDQIEVAHRRVGDTPSATRSPVSTTAEPG